jgi:hypothetical protein
MTHSDFRKFTFIAYTFGMSLALAAPNRGLDLEKIHAQYRNGDFDKVIKDLDGFLKSGRKCPRSDSLFLEKHLAVVYAANPATRELGRYHMHKLLDLSPSAEILDMFVGEEVDNVFEKVRKEHALSKGVVAPVRIAAVTAPARVSGPVWRPTTRAPVIRPEPIIAPEPKIEMDAIPPVQPAPNPEPIATETDTTPAFSWGEKGAWIGGGTALALVAFTLYYAGSPKESDSKTYVVPSATAH